MGSIKTGYFNSYGVYPAGSENDAMPPKLLAKLFGDNIERVYEGSGGNNTGDFYTFIATQMDVYTRPDNHVMRRVWT